MVVIPKGKELQHHVTEDELVEFIDNLQFFVTMEDGQRLRMDEVSEEHMRDAYRKDKKLALKALAEAIDLQRFPNGRR